MNNKGAIVGEKAPSFTLEDEAKRSVRLEDILRKGAVLLVFYPADFTPVCTKQLCNYQDNLEDFGKLGIQVYGISRNTAESHERFRREKGFNFPLLCDPDNKVAKLYGCQSVLLFNHVSRAVFVVGSSGVTLYRHVEPTPITRRTSDELKVIFQDLRDKKLL